MDTAYTLFQRGIDILESGDPAEAARLLEQALAEEPEKASIREALGRAYYSCGMYVKAETHFHVNVGLDPTDDFAHYCLALCAWRRGDMGLARKHIRLARALYPDRVNYRHFHERLEERIARRKVSDSL